VRKKERDEEMEKENGGEVTTPCRMQNRGSIIVIERRHYRDAQNVVVVVIQIFPSAFIFLSLSLSLSPFFLF